MSKNILIVDDEESVREGFSNSLLDEGFKVQSAADGKIALDLMKYNAFDLVLTDLNMPNMGGDAFIKHVYNQFENPPPIIVISSEVTQDSRVLEWGAVAVLKKPVDLGSIISKIKQHLKIQ